MKISSVLKSLLPLCVVLLVHTAQANDTLTRAQVYNFNVGDTFDYEERVVQYCAPNVNYFAQNDIYFKRCIINSIYHSFSGDTLYVIRQWIFPQPVSYDTLIIDSLQNTVLHFSCSTCQYNIDSTSQFENMPINAIQNYDSSVFYAQGLGVTSSIYTFWNIANYGITDSFYLIYHSGLGSTWGTPYDLANGSHLVRYTPIPEECATWIDNSCEGNIEKVTTGNRIAFNGHTYVELLYSALNYRGAAIAVNSLQGYFRNDTLNRKVYLYQALDTNVIFTYDFSVPAAGNVLSLSQINVNGQMRTQWNELCGWFGPCTGYIEGIGGIGGIFNAQPCMEQADACPVYFFNTITCFSVCGQILYPDSGVNCSFPLDIIAIDDKLHLELSPNPAHDICTLQMNKTGIFEAAITDMMGREIMTFKIESSTTQLPITSLPNGVYFIKINDKRGRSATSKLVKD